MKEKNNLGDSIPKLSKEPNGLFRDGFISVDTSKIIGGDTYNENCEPGGGGVNTYTACRFNRNCVCSDEYHCGPTEVRPDDLP